MGVGEPAACSVSTVITLLDHQTPPKGTWKGWVNIAGRGAGKTFAGAHWLYTTLREAPAKARIITPTAGDAVNAPVEQLEEIARLYGQDLTWRPTAPGGSRLLFPNGSVAMIIGTPTPRDVERLRAAGNVTYDWLDEAAANPQLSAVWKQTLFSRRIGETRWIATTTPRPIRLLKQWVEDPRVAITRASTADNPHLAADILDEIRNTVPEGSRMWREEVLGEIIDDFEGALWQLDRLDMTRVEEPPQLSKIVVAVDPATGPGLTGIVVVGQANKELYVLADFSSFGQADQWATVVAEAANTYNARVVAEVNQGGDMVRSVLEAAGVSTPIETVRAAEGKLPRAEPVALLWEKGTAHIVGALPELEDELVSWVPGEGDSPNRLDAMVWGCRWLMGKQYPLAGIFRPKLATPR